MNIWLSPGSEAAGGGRSNRDFGTGVGMLARLPHMLEKHAGAGFGGARSATAMPAASTAPGPAPRQPAEAFQGTACRTRSSKSSSVSHSMIHSPTCAKRS